jgi:hypothetical protein
MLISIRGTLYASVAAAARAHNRTPSAIYSALDRGSLDRVGLRPAGCEGGRPRIPHDVAGRHFPSTSHLARFLGWSSGRVRRTLLKKPEKVAMAVRQKEERR